MRDEFDARIWADHHEQFTTGLARLWADTRFAFERLTARLYDAPWQRGRGTDCR